MGAAESTTRTKEEEEEERQRTSGGSLTVAGAAMALAAVGVAAWGISRMVSENTEKDDEMKMKGRLMEARSSGLLNSSTYNNHGESVLESSRSPRTGWSPPPLGRYKMNTDGSCRPNQGETKFKRGPSGYAGVLRNHQGEWVKAFYGFIGESDSFTAELYGIYYGLLLLDEMGLKEAIIESDCEPAIKWIKEENNKKPRSLVTKNCGDMITDCKDLILKNKISISYFSRCSNELADKLADMAREKREEYKEITEIPAGQIRNIYDQEYSFIHSISY